MDKLKISNKIIKATTKCQKSFACLENPDIVYEVEKCIQDGVCFVKYGESKSCNHIVPYGFSYICTCPTRMEIYYKYSQ